MSGVTDKSATTPADQRHTRPETADAESLNVRVNQDTRHDNRVLDLRIPANQAIYKIEGDV